MVLSDIQCGITVKITGFSGGRGLEDKLRQLGVIPGDYAKVIRKAPFNGPFLVNIRGRDIALGRGVVTKIRVENTG